MEDEKPGPRTTGRLTDEERARVEKNIPLAISIARRWRLTTYRDLQDVQHDAVVALMRAVKGFDGSLGRKFSTYATASIRSYLITCDRKARLIAIPHHLNGNSVKERNQECVAAADRARNMRAQSIDTLNQQVECPSRHRRDLIAIDAVHDAADRLPEDLRTFGVAMVEGRPFYHAGAALGFNRDGSRWRSLKAKKLMRAMIENSLEE